MHDDYDLVYHIFAQWFSKSDKAADCPDQNDAGSNQRQLLNVIGDELSLSLVIHSKYPNYCWYGQVGQAYYDVDRIEAAVVGVFGQALRDQFKSVGKIQVTEGENPVSQVEGCVYGKVACLYDLVRKIIMF